MIFLDREHTRLCKLGEKWLRRLNCGVVFREGFRAVTTSGEQPDAIGWRHNVSILVECKASRADFLADQRKAFRAAGGMGDWRFYLCPRGMIEESEIPAGWGLLYAVEDQVRSVTKLPGNYQWASDKPFTGDKRCEMEMFYSALRRMEIRGHLDAIYEPLRQGVPA